MRNLGLVFQFLHQNANCHNALWANKSGIAQGVLCQMKVFYYKNYNFGQKLVQT